MLDPTIIGIIEELLEEGGGGGSSGRYKGSKATYADLPASANQGDMYRVTNEGILYVWDNGWKPCKETAVTTAQIDALWP